MITHENFRRFLADAEIYIDRIADMRINDMNTVLAAVGKQLLNEIDQSQMSRAERKYFGDCQQQIERYEGILEEMLNYIVKKYKFKFEDIISCNLRNDNVNFGEYGEIYSNYRNRLAHGDIECVRDKEVTVFKILQSSIFFLLLEGTSLNINALRGIVKKLFL